MHAQISKRAKSLNKDAHFAFISMITVSANIPLVSRLSLSFLSKWNETYKTELF